MTTGPLSSGGGEGGRIEEYDWDGNLLWGVDEFVPPMDAAGNYLLTAGSAYGPTSLHWTYHAPNPTDLYSEAISGAQRLANGNTLICDGVHGVLLEVTEAGELVWKYVNPEINTGILYQGDEAPLDIRGHDYNAVFKVERYATDFSAFTGRDLTPSGPVELYRDWIELRNPGTAAVDLGGMYLTNDPSTPKKFLIPSGVSIPAGGYLLFYADNQTTSQTTASGRHLNFTLDAGGGTISLYDIDGITRIDTVTYGAQTTDVSYGRYPDGTGNWQTMTTATPGAANAVTVNQTPTDETLSATAVAENLPAGTPVGTLTTTDPNAGDTFIYSLVSGIGSTDNASFTLSGSTLQTAASFDNETKNSYSIRIRSTDQGGLYFEKVFTISVTLPNQSPVISDTSRNSAALSATVPVWVTSTVTDDGSVSGVTLTYSTGSGAPTTTTVFAETMTTAELRPWTGTGAVNAWTVTGTLLEQRIGSNYGIGNACGLEYKGGAALNALTAAMLTTTNVINAAGTAGYVEFWVQTLTLTGTDGWTFQLDSGSGYVTRLSELTGSSHGWQQYRYDLASTELVSTLKMRFQFTGGGTTGGVADDDRIDLDQITVSVTSGGATTNTVTLVDDGAHGDGAAGDHVYGGQIPALAKGTTVSYYVTATDNSGLVTTDPATAPANKYSYTVGAAALTVNVVATSVAENAGAAATTVTITRNTDTTAALAVNLTSSDTTEATIPATATIPAGQSSVTVNLGAVDDAIVDGTQTVTITASASGFASGSDTLQVTDNDVATLTVNVVATSVAENVGAAATTVTVSRNTDTTAALTVNPSSSDSSEATVPATATIPAGQSSVTVNLAAVDDAIVDGTQTVTITASAAGFTNGSDTLQVTDNDVATLTVDVAAASVAENAGAAATTVTISRNTDTTAALTVNLSSSDSSEATVPATATIPAGQSSVTVNLAAVDDAIVDGTQTVMITASATGFVSGSDALQVTDDDVANHTPTDVLLASDSVPENQPAGTSVGTFSTVDPDAWDTFTYALVPGPGDADNGAFRISGNQLVTAVLLDYELKSTTSIRVRTTDQGGLSFERPLTVQILDVNEAPRVVAPIPNQTAPANRQFRFALAPDTFVDPDASQRLSYAATQADGSPLPKWLRFDSSTRTFSGRPLVRDVGQISVRVMATDSSSPPLAAWAEFSITVTSHLFPWQNAEQPEDVDGNGLVTPQDVLIVINWINGHGGGPVPTPFPDPVDSPLFFDVYGDNLISSMDVLVVINYLNGRSSFTPQAAEGEGMPAATVRRVTPVRQTEIIGPLRLQDTAVDQTFGREADLSSPADWDELLGVLAQGSTARTWGAIPSYQIR